MPQRDRGARAEGRFQNFLKLVLNLHRARIWLLMKQAPIEGVKLQKRKFCAYLKSVLLLQLNLTSMSVDYWVDQW